MIDHVKLEVEVDLAKTRARRQKREEFFQERNIIHDDNIHKMDDMKEEELLETLKNLDKHEETYGIE